MADKGFYLGMYAFAIACLIAGITLLFSGNAIASQCGGGAVGIGIGVTIMPAFWKITDRWL